MLKRSKRIRSSLVVDAVLNGGTSKANHFFALVRLPNDHLRHRFSLVISKKGEKSAVKRNQIRRRVYEAIRLLEREKQVPLQKAYDNVLIVRRAAHKASFSELMTALKELL